MVPESIVIDGTRMQEGGRRNERFLVIVDQRRVLLQAVGFRIFAILGIQRFLGENDGWVQSSTLYRPAEIVSRYIYRMKGNIYNAVPRLQSWRVVENDRQGQYRLIAKPGTIFIEPVGIRQFGDYELGQMMDKLVAIAKEQPSYR